MLQRLARWRRKHQTSVTVVVVTVVAAALLSAALLGFANRTIQDERDRVTKVFEASSRSLDAIDEFVQKFTGDERVPRRVRRDYLERVKTLYEALADSFRGDPALLSELGWAHTRAGNISEQLGLQQKSIDLSREAIKVFETLREEKPNDPKYLRDLAQAAGTTADPTPRRSSGRRGQTQERKK